LSAVAASRSEEATESKDPYMLVLNRTSRGILAGILDENALWRRRDGKQCRDHSTPGIRSRATGRAPL